MLLYLNLGLVNYEDDVEVKNIKMLSKYSSNIFSCPPLFHHSFGKQVMAIATLAACYNNAQVFRGVVKIRKGLAVTLMMEAKNMRAVKDIMARQTLEVCGSEALGDVPESN